MSVKPVNGQCPEGYIYVEGGEDGKSGGSCMRNPFAMKTNKDGVSEYDKRNTSFAGKYAKAILDKMPEELRNEDVYNNIINRFVFSGSLSKKSPLYEVIQLTNQGDVAGLNKILSDISSGNNTKYIQHEINDWNTSGIYQKDSIKKASDFPSIPEIQYPYPRSSEKTQKEIEAENFYQANPKSRFAGIIGEEINPNNYGTARNVSGAITNPSKGVPIEPSGFDKQLIDSTGIRVDSETQDIINFNQQRISDIQKLSEGIRNQIDSGIGTDGKKLNNKELESLRLQLKGNDEELINSRNKLRSAGQSMPLGVSQSFGVNQFPQSQQQTTPPPQPVIPPTTPQGQVEFMQQQAQQMPVPNEVSSRTQFPQMTGGIPEAEQQVGMQEEMPQDNGSIFQRLRNLFSGKSPQPPQPSIAPQTTPQQPVDNRIMGGGAGDGSAMGQTTMPINTPIDNRVMGGGAGGGSAMNEMMPKEFQNAQNLGQQVTQPGMFGGGKSDGGSMGQSATTGLSGAFANAGESPIGTTGAVAGTTNVNTGALPQNVVDNAQTQTDITTGTGTGTGTTSQTGGGTPPPPFATPGIAGRQTGTGTQTGTAGGSTFSPQFIAGGGGSPNVNVLGNQLVTVVDEKGQKKQVLQDLIEIGGTGFDDEVLARKLRRQAAMPDLKNEDYYPNEPFTQAQTAWGDPIFSGAGALFPMAAYDAQRKARAQAEIDEAKRDVMQIKIPEIKTGAYVGRFRTDYIDAVTGLTDEYVKKYGSSQKAIRAMRQDGSLAKLQSQYEGIARSIDQTADRAKEFLKNAQEKSTTMYFSPEGVRAATNFMNGMGAYADGLISAEQLNQLEEQFNTAERWTLYKDRALSKFKPNDYIPTQQQLEKPSAEDMAGFKAAEQEALRLKGAKPDFKKWIFAKKYSEAALPKVMSSIVEPFFSENSTAAEQLVNPGESIDDAKSRVAQSIVDLLGRQIEVGEATQTAGGNTSVTINTGGTTTEKPYYENINAKRDDIISGTKDAIDKINKANQQGQQRVGALQGAFKNMFRGISDQGEVTKGYVGFEPVNVKPYNFKVQPSLLGEYVIFDEKTKSFRKSTPTDFPELDAKNFETTAAGGNLTGQEIVLMTPNGKLVPWDSKDIPAGSELFVKQKITIDYVPKGINASTSATMAAKSKTVYSIGPITQNFKVADDVFQARTLQEATKGEGQPFKFGK